MRELLRIISIGAAMMAILGGEASAQSCGSVTASTLSALSARKTGTSMTYIPFEGACVEGAIDCSSSPIPSVNVITTCPIMPTHVQAGIAKVFTELAGQPDKSIGSFIAKCISAGSKRNEHPTDHEVGRAILVCMAFDKGAVDIHVQPRPKR